MPSDSWHWTDMPNLSGRTVVVTGANSGVGFEATRAFAAKGADVIMACRSIERADAAREDIAADLADLTLDIWELDLADLDSVHSFADKFERERAALDILCNNAGVMAIPRSETANGFEMQFGVNHLGHFALTGLLIDDLRAADGETRVVTQSSGVHERGRIDFDDLQHEDGYDKWEAYAQSKLANLLFAYELDRRLAAAEAGVTSLGCHPGWAATNLQRRGPEESGSKLRLWASRVANAIFAQSAERGALPMLYAATADSLEGGEYVGPGGLLNMRGAPEVQESSDRSYDAETARRLWEVSVELCGVTYDLPASDPTRGASSEPARE